MSTKHTLKLTRGALYVLEGILQDIGPCTTPAKITKWSSLWAKVRAANNRRVTTASNPDGYDIEKSFIRREGESEILWANRQQEHSDARDQWREQPVTLVLSDKQRDIAREAANWVVKNQNPATPGQVKAAVRLQITGGDTGILFAALGLSDEDEGDDEISTKSAAATG